MTNVKRVYTFGNKEAEGNGKMRELLGGKGANLAEMNLIGIPVPPGFTITTELVKPITDAISSGLTTLVPVGLGIMATFIGISLIPRIIYKFL